MGSRHSRGSIVSEAADGSVGFYRSRGYCVARGVVQPDLSVFLTRYLLMLWQTDRMSEDTQVPGSTVVYGDPAFDTLLELAQPTAEAMIGHDLLPTYSFARLYRKGTELRVHRDRPSCQHSMTVHLGGDAPWPVLLKNLEGEGVSYELGPGDALLYQGCDVPHWREPYEGEWYGQVFLHFVDAAGPFSNRKWDTRPMLGLPHEFVEVADDSE